MPNSSILVAGAGGRMGKAIVAEILKTPGASLAGGFERPGGPDIGKDMGVLAGLDAIGLAVEDSAAKGVKRAGVMIDFTVPKASVENARAAAVGGVAHVIGTTGFSAEEEAAIADLATKIPIVKSGNMSVGVNILTALVERAANALDESFDIEIHEAHHRHKVDAPSGTALMLGRAAAAGRGVDLNEKAAGMAGSRAGERAKGDIGFSVERGGGIVGEHRVSFAGEREVIALSPLGDRSIALCERRCQGGAMDAWQAARTLLHAGRFGALGASFTLNKKARIRTVRQTFLKSSSGTLEQVGRAIHAYRNHCCVCDRGRRRCRRARHRHVA